MTRRGSGSAPFACAALAATLALAGGAPRAPAQQPPEPMRYHIVGWVQWDDQRIELGDQWLEGPASMRFELRVSFVEQTQFDVQVVPIVVDPATTKYIASIMSRQRAGTSARGRVLWEADQYRRDLVVHRGEAAQITAPFEPDSGEAATLNIRIEGPRAPLPSTPLPWRYDPRGARIAGDEAGSMSLSLQFWGPVGLMRIGATVGGASTLVPLFSRGLPVVIPGVRDSLSIKNGGPVGPEAFTCISIRRYVRTRSGREAVPEPELRRACFPRRDPWSPIEVRLPSGERLVLQLLGFPVE